MSQMSKIPSSKCSLKSLSVFTGAGGMDIGLEQAGFTPICYLDNDSIAQETIRLNRPDWPLWEDGDVGAAAARLIPVEFGMKPGDLDLISGGPPCQPFSTAAQWAASGRQGMADVRSQPVHALLKLIDSFLPRVVFLENVQGFLTGRTSALSEITNRIETINDRHGVEYQVYWQVVNAADFGVPQNRKRAITIILRDDVSWKWPEPTHVGDPITSWDALADLDESETPLAQGKWTELLPSIPEGWNYQWLTSRGGGEELFGYRTRFWNFLLKLAKNRPSWTLPASPGPAAGPFHWDNRPLTTRERMRLQSFPDHWELAGDYRSQTRLVGNATPPLLAEAIGVGLVQALGYTRHTGELTLLTSKTGLPAPSSKVEPIPARFQGFIGPKASHMGSGRGPSPRPKLVGQED